VKRRVLRIRQQNSKPEEIDAQTRRFRVRLLKLLPCTVFAHLLAGSGTAMAQDAAGACATSANEDAVHDVLKSQKTNEAKAEALVLLAKTGVTAGWQSLTRKGDFEEILKKIGERLLKTDDPEKALTTEELGAQAKAVSQSLAQALNALCANTAADASTLEAAATTAAGIPAPAAPVTEKPAPVKINSSGDSYGAGDRLKFYTATDGFTLRSNGTPAEAPCGAQFRVTGVDTAGEAIIGYFSFVPKAGNSTRIALVDKCVAQTSGKTVAAYQDYSISAERLAQAPAYASGYKFGVLVAPYKFHFRDNATTPSATLGGYFGYEFGNPGISWGPVLSVGLGAVTETEMVAVEGEEQEPPATLTSLSAAAGVLFRIRKAGGFTVGILLGSDWTGKEDRYRYDGDLWAAISLGLAVTE
jgi:hypothetical protein